MRFASLETNMILDKKPARLPLEECMVRAGVAGLLTQGRPPHLPRIAIPVVFEGAFRLYYAVPNTVAGPCRSLTGFRDAQPAVFSLSG